MKLSDALLGSTIAISTFSSPAAAQELGRDRHVAVAQRSTDCRDANFLPATRDQYDTLTQYFQNIFKAYLGDIQFDQLVYGHCVRLLAQVNIVGCDDVYDPKFAPATPYTVSEIQYASRNILMVNETCVDSDEERAQLHGRCMARSGREFGECMDTAFEIIPKTLTDILKGNHGLALCDLEHSLSMRYCDQIEKAVQNTDDARFFTELCKAEVDDANLRCIAHVPAKFKPKSAILPPLEPQKSVSPPSPLPFDMPFYFDDPTALVSK